MPTTVKFSLIDLQNEIQKHQNPLRASNSQRFFKTAYGQYGHGDIFIGLTNPISRQIANTYQSIMLSETEKLLQSPVHEHRLIALLILIIKFQKGDSTIRRTIYDLYLGSTKYINNWDLVDLSASQIVGEYLVGQDRSILIQLANSASLWERRISIISTFAFLRQKESSDSLKIAEILLNDKHDLIHKAVGWVLREVGKRCGQEVEESFLQKYYHQMPRTMLRYAIERFPEPARQAYLHGQL